MARHWTSRSMIAAGMFATVAAASACTPKVTRDEFNSEVAKIREEMQTGDQQLGTRVDSLDGRVNALEQELAAFKSEYNVSIEKMKGAMKFNVPVHFDFNESALREADRPVLDRFANVVQEYYPNAVVTVEGFADPAGSRAYNQQLGMRRAEAVRDYLTSNGTVTNASFRTVSYGEATDRQVVPGAKGPGDA
ncbi:MAG TPA: OmpA family protein, partial [Gemmatimonadales bacterium]|nr:OmpA family protein [Gemmatimonadales bacterium]